MAQDDPFTLDLFNNTALSSGLGLGVTAFAGVTVPSVDGDDFDTPAPALPIAAGARRLRLLTGSAEQTSISPATAPCEGLERSRARQYRRDPACSGHRSRGARGNCRGAGAVDPFHRIRCVRARQLHLPPPGRDRDSARAGRQSARTCRTPSAISTTPRWRAAPQYAHFTPEFIVRAIWAGLQRLGWRGGRVLEPGDRHGAVPGADSEGLREASHVTGIELDP